MLKFEVKGLNEKNTGFNFNIVSSFNDKYLTWSLAALGKSVVKTEFLFEEINEYIQKFITIDEQEAIFNLLSTIHNELESNDDPETIHNKTKQFLNIYLNYFEFENVKKYVLNSSIVIPDNFLDNFTYDITKNITRDKTYTRDDYAELITLVFIIRATLPILSHYITIIKSDIGNEYKESYALSLLNHSKIYNHRSMHKLLEYIQATVNIKEFNEKEIAIKGITIEEFEEILLAKTLIRRLLVSDFKDVNSNHNLITYVYKFMNQIRKEYENKMTDKVNIKQPISSGESESSLSSLEQFKLKQDVSIGDIVTLEHYLKDDNDIINKLYPNLNRELLNVFYQYYKILEKQVLYSPQINLLRILFKNIISPKNILYLPKDKIVKFISIGATILWQEELYFLSLLIGGTTKNTQEIVISSTGSRGRLSTEIQNKLNIYYPYNYLKRDGNFSKNKPVNVAIDTIDKIINEFSTNIWYSNLPIEMLRKAMGDENYNDNKIIIPHNIRNELGTLFILVASNFQDK